MTAAATANMAPLWRPDLGPVLGPAAHQSLQRLSTPAMQSRLMTLRVHRAEQAGLNAPDRADRLRSLDGQIAATELALRWRGVTS